MNRRSFLSTLGAASAGLAIGGLSTGPASAGLSRRTGRATAVVARASLDSYDRTRLRRALEVMLSDLGGLGDIIRPGDSVGIKINLTGGHASAVGFEKETGLHPGSTFWTHPEVLRVVGELARDAGAGRLYVLEALPDEESVPAWGYGEVVKSLGALFIDLNLTAPYGGYARRPVAGSPLIYETFVENGILNDIDCLISLAKAKRHNSIGVTHGMKNLIGLLPVPAGEYNDGQWNRMTIHRNQSGDGSTYNNLARITLDLVNASPIHLTVNDAIDTVLGGEGPWTGLTTRSFGTLVAGKDVVAADAIATRAMGFDPTAPDLVEPFTRSLNYLRLADELGMGVHDPARIVVKEAVL